MNILPLIEALPQIFSVISPDDSSFGVLAMLLGTIGGIKLNAKKAKAKVRREDESTSRRPPADRE